jgi:hypothetical protein
VVEEDQIKMAKVMVMKDLLVHKIQVLMVEMVYFNLVETTVLVEEEPEDFMEEAQEHNLVMTFHQQEEVVEVQT